MQGREGTTQVRFSNDELILTLVSLIRATDPRMLRQGPDGFEVSLAPLERKTALNPDEQLLLKLHNAFSAVDAEGNCAVELTQAESQRLAVTLQRLEGLQPWPEDVLALCRGVRARLAGNAG